MCNISLNITADISDDAETSGISLLSVYSVIATFPYSAPSSAPFTATILDHDSFCHNICYGKRM